MSIARSQKGRFSAQRLFAPHSVLVAGHGTPEGARVLANMEQAGFAGATYVIERGRPHGQSNFAQAVPCVEALSEPPDLAILAGPEADSAWLVPALGALGTRAAIAISALRDPVALGRASNVRIMGPMSFGVASPGIGLNASVAHMPVPRGRIALITQSASLARAALDWAGPNGVGFSHIIGVGANKDLGFGAVLDWLSRDPETALILLDIRHVRERRAFISAARAASRLRPIVAIRPGGRLADPSGRADGVFCAALNRAGVFVVNRLEDFLAAAETLSRSRPARGEALAVVTNAISPGRLAGDAAVLLGIRLATLPDSAQAALAASVPAELIQGLVYAHPNGLSRLAEVASMVGAVPEVGGVLVLMTPNGDGDAATVQALIAASKAARLPMLTCVMGETTGAAHRRALAEAGCTVFATPEQAVQAFHHLLRARQARIDAAQLPGEQVLDLAVEQGEVREVVASARAEARRSLTSLETLKLLAAYGIRGCRPGMQGEHLAVRVLDDPMFGPAMELTAPGYAAVFEMPPLNLPLAEAMARRAGLGSGKVAQVAAALVRVSQMVVDVPAIARLEIDPLIVSAQGLGFAVAAIGLRPVNERAYLAIPPYPQFLARPFSAHGQEFMVRPIRPEDAHEHEALLRRVPAEDMRYRFFSAVRQVSPEQIARLTQIDYEREMAFIAVRRADGATVGVSRLVRERMGDPRGEFALLVEPSAKGLGLGSHLMRRLFEWAKDVGISEIVGEILVDNLPMLSFVKHLGFALAHLPEEPELVEAVYRVG